MESLEEITREEPHNSLAETERRIRPRLMFAVGMQPTKIGGMEKFLRYLVDALDVAGWDSILCFDGAITDEFRDYFASPRVTIERLDNQGRLGIACSGQLWTLLRRYKPKIFVYAFHSVMRCFPWFAKMAGCSRVFFNDHSSRPNGQAAQPLRLSRRIAGRLLTAPLTAIVSVSDFTRRTGEVMGISATRNFVVSNGVEVRSLDVDLRLAFRKRFGISNHELVITQVCWMVEVKGVETMLHAAQMLLRDRAGVRFLLVGGGSELPKYRKLATELGIDGAVTFTDVLSKPTDSGVFDATDIYCQPSVWQEACPLAVLEAMSFGLPVIASNTGGLPELVRDEFSGILVPVRGVQELYLAMKRLVDDTGLRRRLGDAGYKLTGQEHRIEDTVKKYVDIFVGQSVS